MAIPDLYDDENEIIDDDDFEETPYEDDHICPKCGAIVVDIGGNYDDEPIKQVCYDCGWENQYRYD